MSDKVAHFTITARVRRADWPGRQAVCSILSAPRWFPDMWLLSDGETGRTSELRVYLYRDWRAA